MSVIDQFKSQADEDTGIPRHFQGQQDSTQGADATATGRAMLADQSTKLLRSAIMNIDVDVIIPKLEMMYDHNMMYHEDDTVKGDCQVVARGANAMLMRDSARQSHMAMLELTNNPEDRQIMGVEGRAKLLKAVFDTYPDIDDGVIPNDETIEKKAQEIENAPPPPDPAILKIEAQSQMDQAKLAFEQEKQASDIAQADKNLEQQRSIEMMKMRSEERRAESQNAQNGGEAEAVRMEKQYELDKRKQDIQRETEMEKIHVQAQLKREEIAANVQATMRTAAMQQQSTDKQTEATAAATTQAEIDPKQLQQDIIDAVMKNIDSLKDDMTGAINDIQKMVEKNGSMNEAGNFVFNFGGEDGPVTKTFSTTRDAKGNLSGTVTEQKGKK